MRHGHAWPIVDEQYLIIFGLARRPVALALGISWSQMNLRQAIDALRLKRPMIHAGFVTMPSQVLILGGGPPRPCSFQAV